MQPPPTFLDDHVLEVGGATFYCSLHFHRAAPGQLPVMKNRDLVERQIAMVEQIEPKVIVEFGIQAGGSTALLAALARPTKMLALELAEVPVVELAEFIEREGLTDVVFPHYGVDQGERQRLEELVDAELGATPIDLVLDDASHLYAETLVSFELLFPRLRAGGTYIVEDWHALHLVADALAASAADPADAGHAKAIGVIVERMEQEAEGRWVAPIPLTQLAVELVIARASAGDVIRSVAIDEHWIVITRGADPLPADGFRLADHVRDHEGFLGTSRPEGSS